MRQLDPPGGTPAEPAGRPRASEDVEVDVAMGRLDARLRADIDARFDVDEGLARLRARFGGAPGGRERTSRFLAGLRGALLGSRRWSPTDQPTVAAALHGTLVALSPLLAAADPAGSADAACADPPGCGDRQGVRPPPGAAALERRRDAEGLRRAADAGDPHAVVCLAELLAARADRAGAIALLRPAAAAGNWDAAVLLADLHLGWGEPAAAIGVLRGQAAAGDATSAVRLADLLAAHGDVDEALRVLAAPAGAGDREAAVVRARLLAERDAAAALGALADGGDRYAARCLADLLAAGMDLAGLRERADGGDRHAAIALADLLADSGDLDELRRRALGGAGDWYAGACLADRLVRAGDQTGAEAVLTVVGEAGDWAAVLWLACLFPTAGSRERAARVLRRRPGARGRASALAQAETLRRTGRFAEAEARRDRCLDDLVAASMERDPSAGDKRRRP